MTEKKSKKTISNNEIDKRKTALRRAASEQLAKDEQVNFRIEERTIRELQELSSRRGRPLGTMIREWVLERLTQEKLAETDATGKALLVLDETYAKLTDIFESPQASASVDKTQPRDTKKKGLERKLIRESGNVIGQQTNVVAEKTSAKYRTSKIKGKQSQSG